MDQPRSYKRSVVIDNDAAQGQRVQADILADVQSLDYSEQDMFAIRLAVEEAIVNAIKHGNRLDPSKKVRIHYEVTEEQFRIEIEDDGAGFDPGDVPDPTSPEFLERPCGRGLMLMRHYMSDVEYNDDGTCVKMLKRKGEEGMDAE